MTDVTQHVDTLQRDGITGLKAAFTRDWADAMREDMMTAFWSAIQRPGGAVGRGPRRWYVENPSTGYARVCGPRDPPLGHSNVQGRAGP